MAFNDNALFKSLSTLIILIVGISFSVSSLIEEKERYQQTLQRAPKYSVVTPNIPREQFEQRLRLETNELKSNDTHITRDPITNIVNEERS